MGTSGQATEYTLDQSLGILEDIYDNLPPSQTVTRPAACLDLAHTIFDLCTDPRLIMVADQKPGSELITNGKDWTGATGATPPTGWTVGIAGTFTVTADGGPSGTGDDCLKLEVNATPDANPRIHQSYTTVVGKEYTIAFWFEDDGTCSGTVKIGTSANDATYATHTVTDASWKYYQTTFTATTTTTFVTLTTVSAVATEYCQFDNVTCTLTCQDYSSNGHNGTFQGAMTSGDRVDQGSVFMYDPDGSNDHINFGDDDGFSFDDSGAAPFTVGALIEITSQTSKQIIISKYDYDNTLREWYLSLTNLEEGYFRTFDESTDAMHSVTSSILSNKMHLIINTYDGSGGQDADDGFNMYVDGVLDNVSKSGTIANYTAMEPSTTSLVIGCHLNNGDPTSVFKNNIGAVFLDGSEWSAADIWNLWLEVKGKYGL